MRKFTYFSALNRPVCRLIMGTSFWKDMKQSDANKLFDTYTRLGGNCFDTALVYYNVESTLGRWMKDRRNRDTIIIHAKGAHHDGTRKRVTPPDIRLDLNETLARLGTGYVDLFTLHRDDPDQPVGPIIECLAALQSEGKIRAFGASNWSIPRIQEANAYARKHRLPGFVLSSPNLALAFPNEPSWPNCVTACDRYSRAWYKQSQMPLFAWSCLALGFFNNSYKPCKDLAPKELEALLRDAWKKDVVRVYYSDRNFERLSRANALARMKGVSATQIALAWVLHQPMNVFAVLGPRKGLEIEELFECFDISLTPKEVAWLNLERESGLRIARMF